LALFLNKLYFTNAIWRINEYLIYDEKDCNIVSRFPFRRNATSNESVSANARIGGLDIAGGLKEALNNGISKQANLQLPMVFSK
jgi:hypothetical protein